MTTNCLSVLHVVPSFQVAMNGGVATTSHAWALALSAAGHRVGVYLFREGKSFIAGPAGLKLIHSSPEHPEEAALQILRSFTPQLLHHHTSRGLPLTLRLKSLLDIPLVVTLHASHHAMYYDMGRQESQSDLRQEATAINEADRLIAESRSELQLMSRYFPESRSRISVVGHTISDSRPAREAVRQRQAANPVSVLFASLYNGDLKGVPELCAAIPRVLEQAPQTRFVLAGGPKTGSAIQEKTKLDVPASCSTQVRCTGWLPPEQMGELYRAADILVVPSNYEPFGLVVLEGMLHGLAIAASELGGPAEILDQGRTGLLFPPGNVDGLVAALVKLIRQPRLRAKLGAAAAEEVRQKWCWKPMVNKMETVYRDTINTHQQRIAAKIG